MTTLFDELYDILSEQVNRDPEYQKKRLAMSGAVEAIVEEMESLCGENCRDLLDVMGLLDARKQELHEQMLFRAAVQFGMELGRMAVS